VAREGKKQQRPAQWLGEDLGEKRKKERTWNLGRRNPEVQRKKDRRLSDSSSFGETPGQERVDEVSPPSEFEKGYKKSERLWKHPPPGGGA